MQTLYEWDFRGGTFTSLEIESVLTRIASEFVPGMHDVTFMRKLLLGVLEKKEVLDNIIEKAAPDWPIDKIAVIDRNILRIGLFELLFENRVQVPAKVAINEAIELAKTFGGETSGKFVNGVLGAVYKELGEPGKDEMGKKKTGTQHGNAPADSKTFPLEKLGGAIVYARINGGIYFALVHDIFGHWTLSKGHFQENEDDRAAIVRVVNEEIGLPVIVGELLGENEYVASHPEKGKLRKRVSYYLAEAPYHEIVLQKQGGGLDDAKWFSAGEILDLNMYDDVLPIFTKAVTLLKK
jgi:N utilization substance protein B